MVGTRLTSLHSRPKIGLPARAKGGNYMSVLALFELQVKPENISKMKSYLAEILPDSRAYDGAQKIDVYSNTEDTGNMVVVEYWDSRAHHERYAAWRTETGFRDIVDPMLTGPASIRYFERIDI
jgi:quinol monooxygenase YgiN